MYHTKNNTTHNVGQCTATVICDTQPTENHSRLITMELVYPRYIHSEFMTHRMFSRNASSSRATPVKTLIKDIRENPVIPSKWYLNKKGMVGDTLADTVDSIKAMSLWATALLNAVESAEALADLGIHKQHINRLLEPFSFIRVIVTATEWDNFFKLRLAPDAQPEIQDLAKAMKASQDLSTPSKRYFHLPYITDEELDGSILHEDLFKISSARCARVSYLKHDGTKPSCEDDLQLFDRLSKGGHMSPLEHACCHTKYYVDTKWANLKGAYSYRYMLENGM